MSATASDLLPSPCVGTCTLDEATGWCFGCGRSGAEIGAWRDLSEGDRRGVWQHLPARLDRLGQPLRLWPWTGARLFDRLCALAEAPGTVWTLGVYGALGEFSVLPDDAVTRTRDATGLTLQTARGGLSLRVPRGARLFEQAAAGAAPHRLVLALHSAHLRETPAETLTEFGPDAEALRPAHRSHRLFDLGLGRPGVRFCIRSGDAALIDTLRARVGCPWTTALPALEAVLLAHNPDRVLLGPAGRLEIGQPIGGSVASPGTPEGPHTHLLPALLATGHALEPGLALPGDYVPCLTVYAPRPERPGMPMPLGS